MNTYIIMLKKKRPVACVVWLVVILFLCYAQAEPVVHNRMERTVIFSNDYGKISADSISDGPANASYLLHTFTLQPQSMFLPVILNTNIILYVKSGRGKIGWADESKSRYTDLEEGDILRVLQGVVFFFYCHPKTVFPLQIHSIFIDSDHDLRGPEAGPYATIQDLLLGFDKKDLQTTFKVSVEVINQLLGAKKPPLITHVDDPKFLRGNQEDNTLQDNIVKANIFKEDLDFYNAYGWTTTLSEKALNGSDVGFFMVNLTAGSMMEPNWNSMHEEVVVVLEGRGMVRVVCSEFSQMRGCSTRFEVTEGDVFLVPRLHAKALMAFDDGPLIVMGFAKVCLERKEPQFLGGPYSVLGNLGIDVVAKTFNVSNTAVAQLLAHTKDGQAYSKDNRVILACRSCAEEESRKKEQRDGGGGTELQENDHDGEFDKILKI